MANTQQRSSSFQGHFFSFSQQQEDLKATEVISDPPLSAAAKSVSIAERRDNGPNFSGTLLGQESSQRRSSNCWPELISSSFLWPYFLVILILQISVLGGQKKGKKQAASAVPDQNHTFLSGSRKDRDRSEYMDPAEPVQRLHKRHPLQLLFQINRLQPVASNLIISFPTTISHNLLSQLMQKRMYVQFSFKSCIQPPTLLLGVAQTGLKKLNPEVTSVGSSNLKEFSES